MKTKTVLDYPIPKDVRELCQFLGLANYYRQFNQDFSKIADPLYNLTRKLQGLSGSNELKQRLVSPPIHAYPDFAMPFVLHSDASATAIGAILGQIQDGKECVICYWSRQLTKAERNYSTTECEALAAVAAIINHYGFQFKLVTDHNPLTALKGMNDIGGRLSRWMTFLQQFDYTIEYKPGRYHSNVDALSWCPDRSSSIGVEDNNCMTETDDNETSLQCVAEDENKDDTILQSAAEEENLENITLATAAVFELETTMWGKFQTAQHDDPDLKPLLDALSEDNSLPSTYPGLRKCFLVDDVLCRPFQGKVHCTPYEQVIVPASLKKFVLNQLHDQSGHYFRGKEVLKNYGMLLLG